MSNIIGRHITSFLLITLACFFTACNVSHHIPDGKFLLVKNEIIANDKTFDVNGMADYIVQKPNSKWFSSIKIPLGVYSLSGSDTTRYFNRLMRKWGEPPVIIDTTMMQQSAENLRNVAFNSGRLDAYVSTQIDTIGKRAKVKYIVSPNEQYKIRNVTFNISDRRIDSLLNADGVLQNSLLRRGEDFSVTRLQEERKLVTRWLNDRGYRFFNKEMLTFRADTNRINHSVNLLMNIGLFRRSSNEDLRQHPRFCIRNIIYSVPNDEKLRIRLKTLNSNTAFRQGELYSEEKIQKTYNKFAHLQYIRATNITFNEVTDSNTSHDNSLLDAKITFMQRKKHSIQVQPEGTNTAGDLGAALLVTYNNLNAFHGCETFSLQARYAFEAIRGLEGYSNSNYEEYGIEAKISFPTLLVPGITLNYRKRHTNSTDFIVSYNLQNRPEFHRRVMRGTWRYTWENSSGRVGHKIDLIDLNYVSMPWISTTFKNEYLEREDNRNAILKYSYENLLIMKTGYSITYNDGTNSIKANLETAGNMFSGIASLFNFQKNEDGKYTLAKIAFAQYVKTDIDYTHVFRFNDNNIIALHSRIGVAIPFGNSEVMPYEKRYFCGGANSVRGWGVRELGPGRYKGENGRIDFVNHTGDIRLDLNIEYRSKLFWKFQGALFVDAGNIWTIRNYNNQSSGLFSLCGLYEDLAVAYGIGLRLNFDYFILRLDLGMKAVNPVYTSYREHYPIVYPIFKRDKTLHFAVGLPF